MTDDSVPAAEATVWTILFSWMVMPLKPRRTAMEMTAAGMEVEKVNPALRPKNTLAAVKTSVISTPRTMPRTVSSVGSAGVELMRCAPPGSLVGGDCPLPRPGFATKVRFCVQPEGPLKANQHQHAVGRSSATLTPARSACEDRDALTTNGLIKE